MNCELVTGPGTQERKPTRGQSPGSRSGPSLSKVRWTPGPHRRAQHKRRQHETTCPAKPPVLVRILFDPWRTIAPPCHAPARSRWWSCSPRSRSSRSCSGSSRRRSLRCGTPRARAPARTYLLRLVAANRARGGAEAREGACAYNDRRPRRLDSARAALQDHGDVRVRSAGRAGR